MADTATPKDGKSESMEEILQSIKRIMDDEADGGQKSVPEEDVFELTNVVQENKPSEAVMEDVLAPVANTVEAEPAAPSPAPPPPPPPIERAPTYVSKEEDILISEQAASAAAVSFRKIAGASQKDYSIPHIPSPPLRSGATVEDLMLEAIRPMLKEWLDHNLPVIVQKIVEKEIKRIVSLHYD